MARVIQVVPMRTVDFATLPNLGTEDVVLADKLELPHSLEMTMLVRVHAHSLTSSSTISIMAMPQLWTPEDPDKSFVATAPAGPAAVLDVNTPVPGYYTRFLRTVGSSCIGPMTRIFARASKKAAGAMGATVSIDICAKEGTSFLPTHLPNCVLWLHADDYSPTTGAWPDRSGKGNDGSQSTASARPALENKFNGLNDVLFDGVDDYIAADALAGTFQGNDTPFSAAYLYEIVSGAAPVFGFSKSSGSAFAWSGADAGRVSKSVRGDGTTTKTASGITLATATKYAVTERFTGTVIDVVGNGTSFITTGDLDVGSLTIDQVRLGAVFSGGPPTFGNLRIREFALYTAYHSATNLALVANGMRERAALPPF